MRPSGRGVVHRALEAGPQPGPDLDRDMGPVGQDDEVLAFTAGQGEQVSPGFQAVEGRDPDAFADAVNEGPRQSAPPGEIPDGHATGMQKPVELDGEAVCHPIMLSAYPAACDDRLDRAP